MQITYRFSEEEKKFFEVYRQLLEKYSDNLQKLKLFLELKALDLGIENPDEVIEKIHSFLRDYIFFKDRREELKEILPIDDEFLKTLERYPYFVEYRIGYAFPTEAVYGGFKWREPFIIAGGIDGKVRIWRYDDGKLRYLFDIGEKHTGFPAYELYKDHLFYSVGSTLKVFYLPSGKLVEEIDVGQPVAALNLEEGGNLYLYKRFGQLAIKQRIDLDSGKVEFGPADPVALTSVETGETDMVALGKNLLKLKKGRILLFRGKKESNDKKLVKENAFKLNFPINDIYVLGSSAILGTDGAPPQIVDLQTGEILGTLDVPVVHSFRIRKNPVRDELAISHSDNLISIWDIKTLENIKLLESYFIDVLGLDYSPDGKLLVAAGEGRDINVWDTESWEMVKDIDFDFEGVTALKFSPDGKYLAVGGGDNNIYLLSTSDWSVVKTLSQHEDLISDLLFVDGKLVSAGWDGKALVWNLERGEVEQVLQNSDQRVWKLALSRDGGLLAVADWEGKVNIYKTDTWDLVETFEDKSGVTAVAFGENLLLIGRKDGTLEVVKIEPKELEEVVENISANPSEEVEGITTFGGNILVYTKRGRLGIWNPQGERVFSATVEGLRDADSLRTPRLEMKVLPDTFIVRKENNFYGAKGWDNYINILEGLEIVEEKEPFLEVIAEPKLLEEL